MVRSQGRVPTITRVGVLGAIAAVLFLIPGVPIIPPIYKLDFSTVPVLLAGFSMGIGPAMVVLLIKDLAGLFTSSSMGVGELADFLVSSAMMIAAVMIYNKNRTMRGALWGMLAGVVAMVVVGALSNYLIIIPFYESAMNVPVDVIVSMISATIPPVDSLWSLIWLATVPFNLLKGVVLCVVTVLLYKRIRPLLKPD